MLTHTMALCTYRNKQSPTQSFTNNVLVVFWCIDFSNDSFITSQFLLLTCYTDAHVKLYNKTSSLHDTKLLKNGHCVHT